MIELKKAGRKPKYDFTDFDLNETRAYKVKGKTPNGTLISCAHSYCELRGLNWKFKSYTVNGKVHLIRIK